MVRDERCTKPPSEIVHQRVAVVVGPPASPPFRPEPPLRPPTWPGRNRPIEVCGRGRSTPPVDDPRRGNSGAPQSVGDDGAPEVVGIVLSCLAETHERPGVPAENLATDTRVGDEARPSGVDGTEVYLIATQQGVEILPPLLAAIIGLGREPHEPPPERVVLPAGATPAETSSP